MENIMLDTKKTSIKLIDFGLSNIYKESDPLKTHCGSPEYAAPELFVVGKTYGPEIDIWSLGIIAYAMIVGRLPFTAPYKDEYMRQRLLQAITKGMSSYHEKEMQTGALTPDCRNLLHQLIEPKPELRIPLSELEQHPWITRNGKLPFSPYQPIPKDKNLRRQVVGELCIMMNLKRKHVDEIVKETKADELSAMFNMLTDKHRRDQGLFDGDHTFKKVKGRESRSRSRERDKLGQKTPESIRGRDPRGRSGLKKVPNKLMTPPGPKAGLSTKALAEQPVLMEPEKVLAVPGSPTAGVGRPSGSLLGVPTPLHGGPVTADKPNPTTATANGPTTRIPLSQRRQPPAKLSLTLDLSVTNSWPANKRTFSISSSIDADPKDVKPGSTLGIAASSGVPPRLSTQSKIPVLSPTKKGASGSKGEGEKTKSSRPTSLQYLRRFRLAESCTGSRRSVTETDGSVDEEKASAASSPTKDKKLVAPKATPEDSRIDTYSTSSSEESEECHQVVQAQAQLETTSMQPEMLNASDDEKLRLAGLRQDKRVLLPANAPPGPTPEPNTSSSAAHANQPASSTASVKLKKLCEPHRPRPALVKHLSESEHYDSTCSDSQVSQSSASPSGTQLAGLAGSGISLPARLPPRGETRSEDWVAGLPNSSSCLPSVSMPASTACLLAPASGSDPLAVASAGPSRHSNPSLSLTLINPSRPLAKPVVPCRKCGLSPGSPTYFEKHSKFCHTGAHALDMFVSPDEVPSPTGPLWRPVASLTQDSPTLHSPCPPSSPIFHFPKRTGKTRVPMQTAVATAEAFGVTDDEYDDEEEVTSQTKPLLSHPCHKCSPPQRRVRTSPGLTSDPELHARTPTTSAHLHNNNASRAKATNNGVRTQVPEPQLTLETIQLHEVKANTSSQPDTAKDGKCDPSDNPDKSGGSCGKTKVHPIQDTKTGDVHEVSSKSRIPRPPGRFARIQVLGLLKRGDHSGSTSSSLDRQSCSSDHLASDSPASATPSPIRSRKSDKSKLLRQSESSKKSSTWRQGLSHLLRMKRPAVSTNNNVSGAIRNNGGAPSGNVSKRQGRASGREDSYQELDARWTAPPSPPLQNQCNSMQMTSSPVPSISASPIVEQTFESEQSTLHEHLPSPPPHPRAKRVSWTGCRECPPSESSEEDGNNGLGTTLEMKVSGVITSSLLPNSNNVKSLQQMTSGV